MSTPTLKGISSMATRQVLADLVEAWQAQGGQPVQIESVGGVDAARRVAEGEPFDFVVLAEGAIASLCQGGAAQPHSALPLARSGMAACVPKGSACPAFASEADVKAAVQHLHPIAYSTGPSGVALLDLFDRWGLLGPLLPHVVQARPGLPVARLVAQGQAALGFQQLSELMDVEGIEILGALPEAIQVTTVFSAAVCTHASQADAAQAFIRFLASPATAHAKHLRGLAPA